MKTTESCKKAITAASRGEGQSLRRLLYAEPEIAQGPRVLNAAALHGQAAAVEVLLAAGADPDGLVPSHEKYRPLHRAIEHRGVPRQPGHAAVVRLLLSAGASLEARATWMSLTPLAVAGMAGEPEFVKLVLARKPPRDIFHAAVLADVLAVKKHLTKTPALATARDDNAMTVLHYAALCGLTGREEDLRRIAHALLDAGADGNARETIGPYPLIPVLHFAAWKNFALAEVLLSRGCNPNFGFGNCLWGKPGPMAELFLAHGADVNGREPSGQPLLNSRIHWNLPSIALWLLKNGADPTATDRNGNTALHEAAARGITPGVVQALLDHGADRRAINQEGKTAEKLARERKKTKLLALLVIK